MAPKKTKPPRSREYTGPKTVEGVIAYLETDAYQKAKENAIASLSKHDQNKVAEYATRKLLNAMEIYRERMDALARARGFKVGDN